MSIPAHGHAAAAAAADGRALARWLGTVTTTLCTLSLYTGRLADKSLTKAHVSHTIQPMQQRCEAESKPDVASRHGQSEYAPWAWVQIRQGATEVFPLAAARTHLPMPARLAAMVAQIPRKVGRGSKPNASVMWREVIKDTEPASRRCCDGLLPQKHLRSGQQQCWQLHCHAVHAQAHCSYNQPQSSTPQQPSM